MAECNHILHLLENYETVAILSGEPSAYLVKDTEDYLELWSADGRRLQTGLQVRDVLQND